MTQNDTINPFHAGELQAQKRAGVGDVAQWASGFVRDHLPEQHRAFHTSVPFLVAAAADTEGRTWVTMVDGPEGFATAPDPRRLELATRLDDTDPLAGAFAQGTDIGVLGIELSNRRRNRFSGALSSGETGYTIDISQTFGNCPQYIHERDWTRVKKPAAPVAMRGKDLTDAQIARIAAADTLFIGSGHQTSPGAASNGYDASHRGGAAGFVRVSGRRSLSIPDYAGNNFFNTIGNLIADPRVGLMFVDFQTGGLLQLSGRATVEWAPRDSHDPEALRMINVEIDEVIDRPQAVGLRWERRQNLTRALKVTRRVAESAGITSFYLAPVDHLPLATFVPGQHLPVEVHLPGRAESAKRSYSLSGAAEDKQAYRLSVKRKEKGQVSRYLHDRLRVGDEIVAHRPSGEFLMPPGTDPLVLISAGVGVTPMLSMLHAVANQPARQAWFLHGARNGKEHAFRDEVAHLVKDHQRIGLRVFYSQPDKDDQQGRWDYTTGRVTAQRVLDLNAGATAQYMICGPAAFISEIRRGLQAGGIADERIHFETFGPAAS